MNVANLQLEGLLMAVAALNRALVDKGVLSEAEVDLALRRAEAGETDQERGTEMPSSNRDAICFPLRLLLLANKVPPSADLPPFSALAKMVGQEKQPYNDEM